jgi:hypothetical protein
MKLNFNRHFLDANHNETSVVISETLRLILFGAKEDEKLPLNADEKYLAYKLMQKLVPNAQEVDITVDEAGFLKKVAGASLVAGAYGQVHDLIEGISY